MAPRRDDSHPEEAEENRRRSSTPLRRSVRVLQGLTDSQRRVIREKQRQVHDHLVNEDYDDLGEVRDENNELFDNVKWTRELVLDADNIDVLATKYAKEVEQNVQVPRYDANKLVHSLVQKCTAGDSFDWKTLGVEAGICFNSVPSRCSFAAGRWDNPAVQATPKKRAVRGPRPVNHAQEVKPDEVTNSNRETAKSSSYAEEQVTRLKKKLKTECNERRMQENAGSGDDDDVSSEDMPTVNGIQFLFDPESFTKTVENLFYYSFLVKRGIASFKAASGEGFEATAASLELGVNEGDEAPPARQGMVSLTLRDYRRLLAAAQADE